MSRFLEHTDISLPSKKIQHETPWGTRLTGYRFRPRCNSLGLVKAGELYRITADTLGNANTLNLTGNLN